MDLMIAYMTARQHKGTKQYVADFEKHLKTNLLSLRDGLLNRSYKARPSTCFIVFHPKQREIFAADFRDRVVHHLIYNYIHEMLERTFVYDTYSCIKHRGTHFGIDRLQHHIRACSDNGRKEVFIMKMDISGYFMHIDRRKLYEVTRESIMRMADHHADSSHFWRERIDIDFVLYLVREIIMLDPAENCHIKGSRRDWKGLPDSKSLFKSGEGKGLPIGNLTSQLFSNVYLNCFDQYMKRVVGCRHYGRYVDDFYVVGESREYLHGIIPLAERFFSENLLLNINRGKTKIYSSCSGVDFLGAFVKHNRVYISNQSLRRMNKQISSLDGKTDEEIFCSINSFLGVLSRFKTYNIRRKFVKETWKYYKDFAVADNGLKKIIRNDWVIWRNNFPFFEKMEENGIDNQEFDFCFLTKLQ